ncbi:MAG TPA: hypothetical protein VGQ04_09190 [Chitinophagaceae bacterium]|nr:hypothetical protein [Chitinophagaceae bacterium]
MKPKNVIISLVFVMLLLAFIVIKIRTEPKKKLVLNRNPSRIEYTKFALCRMDCHHINANSIMGIFRNGEVNRARSDLHKKPCPIFTIRGITKQKISIIIIIQQCGTVAKILDCYDANGTLGCDCINEETMPLSFLKTNY